MTARGVGGTTNRNSLSARQANGAAMLVEVDAAAVAVLLLVRLIAKVREVVRPACPQRSRAAETRDFFCTRFSHVHKSPNVHISTSNLGSQGKRENKTHEVQEMCGN